ncbi:hypothetical protein B0H67DRAFT_83448 [Lasiosphaeris hirsuta]|uniref:Uncharacterized protein n=1 Tax=Lasiosphaeris hirsuta TaxID=260670 RepID=A0AA40BCE9_9PEZI|nr:hypothetical protein B0H67DRAFT_83448 [Lasiosphaeris hirsuta]
MGVRRHTGSLLRCAAQYMAHRFPPGPSPRLPSFLPLQHLAPVPAAPRGLSGGGLSFWADRQGQSTTALEFWILSPIWSLAPPEFFVARAALCRILDFAVRPPQEKSKKSKGSQIPILCCPLSTPHRRWLLPLAGCVQATYVTGWGRDGRTHSAPTAHPQEPQRIRPSPPQAHRPAHRQAVHQGIGKPTYPPALCA